MPRIDDSSSTGSGASAVRLLDYDGGPVVADYGDVDAEWAALDAGVGIVEATWRCFFPATGEERRDFLHGQTSADVRSLRAGEGRAALVLTAQGRPLAMPAIYEDGDRIWIATTAAHQAATRAALSRFLVADDCDFEDVVEASSLTLVGPRAADLLATLGALPRESTPTWSVASVSIAGQPVMLFGRADFRVPAFDLLVCDAEGNAGDAAAVRDALHAAGAMPCGATALDIVRVESGCVRYGVDVDEQRIGVEARLEWAIHFAKGCYVGQEVIERAVSRGRINHELGLLRVDAEISIGALVEGGGERDVVTSVVRSPKHGVLALAYLPKAKFEPGSAVVLRGVEDAVSATVQTWPRPRVLAGRS